MFIKTSLIVAAGVALALPFSLAFAQSADDVGYCNSLSATTRTVNRGADPQGSIANAMAQCSSNPAASIPVLEKFLTDSKVSLPPRPMSFNPKMYPNMADCLTAAAAAKAPLNLCGPKQGM
jgi:hypothetical protein